MGTDDVVQEISDLECWELLSERELGRLAYHLLDEVHIVPLNYRAVPRERRLLFRTAEGTKLLGVVMNADVALEVDDLTGERAWSVVARGRARVLEGPQARAAEATGLRSWLDTPKTRLVAIEVTEITGRRFSLRRPWLRMIPEPC